ncbi:UDP-glucuronosyl/UDP-glucosyltransferase [Trinorchestia longiramus]|nr:UDP-glucuronosyl/UDP-glucosyltransferase [Trinorchestia longiramus]
MLYPFVHGTTFAKILASTLHPQLSASFGNPLNPAFVPSNSMEFPRPYSTWHRFKNCMHMLAEYIVFRYLVSHLTGSKPSKVFSITSRFPSLPPLHEVENNASLFMISSDFLFNGPYPVVPLLLPVVGLSFQPAKLLLKDVSEFLSGHTPVIYVSVGTSYGHNENFPQVYNDIFFSVFSQLPNKIILKFDEHPKQHYKNIFIRKWFCQQDILAHPNVKAL